MGGDRIPSLGRRGEGWVIAQSVAIVAIVVAGLVGPAWPDAVDAFLLMMGVVSAAAGVALLAGGIAALGSSLTPFPRPLDRTILRERGARELARDGSDVLLALR